MSSRLDPTQAIEESAATGEVADIFAEIRETMNIPWVTSIWRGLAGMPGGLSTTWAAIRPLMQSDEINTLLEELKSSHHLPIPAPLTSTERTSAGVDASDGTTIIKVVEAYNRSNCLNLIAITSLLLGPGGAPVPTSPHRGPPEWPPLPRLIPPAEICPDHWALLQRTTTIGAAVKNDHIPTLWRHLLHWPGLLEVISDRFNAPDLRPSLIAAVQHTTDWVETHAPRISHLAEHTIKLSPSARAMITNYVGPQPSVARMATVGNATAQWLRASA